MDRSSRRAKRWAPARIGVALAGALLAFAASIVFSGGSDRATATQGQPVLAGMANSATAGTQIYNTNADTTCPLLPGDIANHGLVACGEDAIWVRAENTGVHIFADDIGVYASTFGTGVSASGTDYGVRASSSATAIYGDHAGGEGIGVHGKTNGAGAAMYGEATVNGVGVFGDSVSGTGVQARSPNGHALRVIGRAEFSRSGLATVASGQASKRVSGVLLNADSLILATIQGNAPGVWVRSVQPNIAFGSFDIHLNQPSASRVRVAWFVVEKP